MHLTRRALLEGAATLPIVSAAFPFRAAQVQAETGWPPIKAPAAPLLSNPITQLGRTRDDPYAWMKFIPAEGSRELARLPRPLRSHIEEEAAYAKAMLAPLEPRRAELLALMMARAARSSAEPPMTVDGWQYYSFTPAGGVHTVHARKRPSGGSEQRLLDEAVRAKDHSYYRTTGHQPSPDHRFFAWAEDVVGSDRHRICVRNISTGQTRILVDKDAYGYGGLTFGPSSKWLFWIWRDARNRPTRLYRTPLAGGPSELVYEEQDPAIFMQVHRTAANGFVAIILSGPDTSEVRLISADNEAGPARLVTKRQDQIRYELEEWRDHLLLLTDADGALDRKIVSLSRDDYRPVRTIVAHRPGHSILGIAPFRRALVRLEQVEGLHRLVIQDPSGRDRRVEFDGAAYALQIPSGQDYDSPTVRIVYQAPDRPREWRDIALESAAQTLVAQETVVGFSPGNYRVERLLAPAPDGETVPITIISRKDDPQDGSSPLLLYGYGAYGISSDPEFSIPATVLVDRGWRYAIAHVRGGSEKGRRWFLEGRKFNKRNSFTDFIACAQHLCRKGYTSEGRIVAYGLSAGGLLVGASMNLAPLLWAGVIAKVPFVDMLNTMSDAEHPLVPLFRPDWGDPLADPKAYDYIASISPYENVRPAPYPPLLCTAGLKDDRVAYWEPAKLVANVRRRSTSGNPAILLLDPESGHQGSGNRRDEFSELALFWSFAEKCAGTSA